MLKKLPCLLTRNHPLATLPAIDPEIDCQVVSKLDLRVPMLLGFFHML
ncbi:hypothetical protein PDIG_86510 [Penicillium digitatum PHI26]|uniref:Uncharacterized protein n=2 Tax=Penicillium digitatum TaxID=36651 RepID=K9F6A4_PEND2|nr:hypothetical protein PDIP_32530 [Penicillium digitatum Pd1]EKV04850.1 hypothetical protein PDIG_86510 [Penicillium digitatum PHI26]EKV17237.1 hypothetical protein PDIP_32530 [Penicillium digitatum Pd1]